jgi:hypothetical protein
MSTATGARPLRQWSTRRQEPYNGLGARSAPSRHSPNQPRALPLYRLASHRDIKGRALGWLDGGWGGTPSSFRPASSLVVPAVADQTLHDGEAEVNVGSGDDDVLSPKEVPSVLGISAMRSSVMTETAPDRRE